MRTSPAPRRAPLVAGRAFLTGMTQRRLLSRVRDIFLGYALLMLVLDAAFLVTAPLRIDAGARVVTLVMLVLLGAWWLRGWYRGGFPAWTEPVEWGVTLVATCALGFDLGVAIMNGMLLFRGLYGGRRQVVLRLLCAEATLLLALAERAQTDATLTRAGGASHLLVAAFLLLGLALLREALTAHEQVLRRERSIAAGAARLAASSDRTVVQNVAVQTAMAIARSAEPTDGTGRVAPSGVRVALGVGQRLRYRSVAACGIGSDELLDHAVRLDVLPDPVIATLRRGGPIYVEGELIATLREATGLETEHGGLYMTPLWSGGRDVGVLTVVADVPLPSAVRSALTTWSRQVAASMAGLALTDDLVYRAYHDPLTGLANRDLMEQQLGAALQDPDPSDRLVGFLLIDLDRFKQINDTFGHHAGDTVLRTVALRLATTLRSRDVAARLGGDEFGVVLPDLPGPAEARIVADRLITALGEPIEADGHEVSVGASIGITLRPRGCGTDAQALVREADAAMYRAKATGTGGPGTYVLHDDPARL